VEAFQFFGCVPHEVWWDNPTTVVRLILKGRDRQPNERYAALASHYTFEPLFCMPASGNEKPYAENRVRVLQRQWATPVPQVADLSALNQILRQRCLDEVNRTVSGRADTIGERFQRDRTAALPVPVYAFDACVMQAAQVDKYQTVQFDCNRYSVPRAYAYRVVMVKGYIDRIEVVATDQVVARHQRSYGRDQQILDPLHYLAALGRRPAALDHAPVLRDWQLPESFTQLRQALEMHHGARTGARHYIRVLQLLAKHPLERVRQAVEDGLRQQCWQADRITARVQRLGEKAHVHQRPLDLERPCIAHALDHYQVLAPDLSNFDQLLFSGDSENDREHALALTQ
jgi:hypothetical protein